MFHSLREWFDRITGGCTMAFTDRVTVSPLQCGGRPCVRGMRIRVSDVLDLLATGMTAAQVVEELPDLEPADVVACLRYSRVEPHGAQDSAVDPRFGACRVREPRGSGESS